MNVLERHMIDQLKELKDLGCIQIKAEFEAEGTRMEELNRLKDVTSSVGLPIAMKIGGCESVTDAYNCLLIGVRSIVAPMIETPFALHKYEKMIKNVMPKDNAEDIDFFFNMETITAYHNFKDFMATPDLDAIQGVTIGRSDLTGSMGLTKDHVDDDEVYEIARETFRMAREKGLICTMGGKMTANSIPMVEKLAADNLIDRFETRKVMFEVNAIKNGAEIFNKALAFELEWLKSKRRYYSGVQAEDASRIADIEKRICL